MKKILFLTLIIIAFMIHTSCSIKTNRMTYRNELIDNGQVIMSVMQTSGHFSEFIEPGGFIYTDTIKIKYLDAKNDTSLIILKQNDIIVLDNSIPLSSTSLSNANWEYSVDGRIQSNKKLKSVFEYLVGLGSLKVNKIFQDKDYSSSPRISNDDIEDHRNIFELVDILKKSKIKSVKIIDSSGKYNIIDLQDRFIDFKEIHYSIFGYTDIISPTSIPIEKVLYTNNRVISPTKVIRNVAVFIVVGAAVVGVIVLASSCPLVYTLDHNEYKLDSEPLGGAICAGLQRTDLTQLKYLNKNDKLLKISIRNQAKEQQFIDEMKLFCVDHPLGTITVFDANGNVYAINNIQEPVVAKDEYHNSILEKVSKIDGNIWQTEVKDPKYLIDTNLKHNIKFKFIKPSGAKKAGFVFRVGTSVFGSYMVKNLLELHGNKADEWLDKINNKGLDLLELLKFDEREENYFMKLYVKKSGKWISTAYIPGNAPLAYDNKVIWFDVSDITSDTLELMINPPKLYWSIDYIAMVFDQKTPLNQRFLEPSKYSCTLMLSGEEIKSIDGNYLMLKEASDKIDLEYLNQSNPSDIERSYFLKITGYYSIQHNKEKSEQTELLNSFWQNSGSILDYSIKLFKAGNGKFE